MQETGENLEDRNKCPFERLFMAQLALPTDCSSLADVNECLAGLAMCAHQCLNTRGSFKCTCNPGYELGADGRQCYREYCTQTPSEGTGGGFAPAGKCLCTVLGNWWDQVRAISIEDFHKQV